MKKEKLISAVLKEKRTELKLSGEEVVAKLQAHGIDISIKTLYGYENGVSSPKINTFLCLCDIYGIDDIMNEFGYEYSIAENSIGKNAAGGALFLSDEALRIAAAFDKASEREKDLVRIALEPYMSSPTADGDVQAG